MTQLRIAILSDWGLNTDIKYKQAKILQDVERDIVLTLGDHFYYDGISSWDDTRWKKEYTDIFRPDCPWWAILGNHDYDTEQGEAQLFYSLSNPWWMMPAYYYEIIYVCGHWAIQFLMLDTVRLAPETSQRLLNMKDTNPSIYKAEDRLAQETWLRHRLSVKEHKNLRIRWRIVCGHYTVYSSGMHGNNNEMIELLYPLRDQIDLYICGHDHHTEMSYTTPIKCLVSGDGSFFVRPLSKTSTWIADSPTLPVMGISHDKISIDFFDIEKKRINHTTLIYKH